MEIDVTLLFIGVDPYTLDSIYEVKLPHNFSRDDAYKFFEENKNRTLTLIEPTKKRSLDANAYAWVLLQKIAEKIGSDKISVYKEEIKKYSKAFCTLACTDEGLKLLEREYRAIDVVGKVKVGSQTLNQVLAYNGSSTFNTEEMNVFLNGVCQDAHDLGIPTLEDLEIMRMISKWN